MLITKTRTTIITLVAALSFAVALALAGAGPANAMRICYAKQTSCVYNVGQCSVWLPGSNSELAIYDDGESFTWGKKTYTCRNGNWYVSQTSAAYEGIRAPILGQFTTGPPGVTTRPPIQGIIAATSTPPAAK
jgi:hypothetical protein